MSEIVISFDKDSNATFLVTPTTTAMFPEAAKPRRASHVEPMSPRARFWFRVLRRAFGEYGRVGNWTRTWKGLWQINLHPVGGPIIKGFFSRDNAIEFEINWLNANFL